MWCFLADLDFWQWLRVVVLGLLVVVGWLWVVVDCAIDRFVVFFFGNGIYYFLNKMFLKIIY